MTTAAPVSSKKRFNYQVLQHSIANHPGSWVLATTFVGSFLHLIYHSHWNAALFQGINASNIIGFLTPLIITAAVIERAVEVLISPWRDQEADKKQNVVNNASTLVAAAPDNTRATDSLLAAADDLSQYTGQTRRYAYALALGFSVVAVTAGMRLLWPMLDASTLKSIPVDQQNYFRWFDMLISTLLLAGGAAGIHSPVNAFTSFFEKYS